MAHYIGTINTTMPNACVLPLALTASQQISHMQHTNLARGSYVGVRLQRLDHWLCGNALRGFSCRLFLADVESGFLG